MTNTQELFELVTIGSKAAMDTPRHVYFNQDGISAYSCLIPETLTIAKRVHFVSGTDGEEYGQFASEQKAKDTAASVVLSN